MPRSSFAASAATAAAAIIVVAISQPAAAAGKTRVFEGDRVAVGSGFARTVVVADGAGEPLSVAVRLSGSALKGLPADAPDHHEREYVLPMPKGAPQTGYDHVGLNWNPVGHEPDKVYTVPHFDVHFYLIGQSERAAITFKGEHAGDAAKAPDASLVPTGYVVPPPTAVEHMGVHGVNPASPEFHGKPFTATFIYGYHMGRLIFVEPMITKAFLESKRDVTHPVAAPKAYSLPGQYPTRYRVSYDPKRDVHTVALAGLKRWEGRVAAADHLTPQAVPMAVNAAATPLRE